MSISAAQCKANPADAANYIKSMEVENARLRTVMNDAIALLSDTDLHAEDRAGNALMCLGLGLGDQQRTASAEEGT